MYNKDMTLKKFLKALDELLKVQTAHGNWNYDPYMRGMANGLILARSINQLPGDEPIFLEEPVEYLVDKSDDGKPPIAVVNA